MRALIIFLSFIPFYSYSIPPHVIYDEGDTEVSISLRGLELVQYQVHQSLKRIQRSVHLLSINCHKISEDKLASVSELIEDFYFNSYLLLNYSNNGSLFEITKLSLEVWKQIHKEIGIFNNSQFIQHRDLIKRELVYVIQVVKLYSMPEISI